MPVHRAKIFDSLVVEFDDGGGGGDYVAQVIAVYENSLYLAITVLETLLVHEAFLMLDSPMLKTAGEEPSHLRQHGLLVWSLLYPTLDLNAVLQIGNFVVT